VLDRSIGKPSSFVAVHDGRSDWRKTPPGTTDPRIDRVPVPSSFVQAEFQPGVKAVFVEEYRLRAAQRESAELEPPAAKVVKVDRVRVDHDGGCAETAVWKPPLQSGDNRFSWKCRRSIFLPILSANKGHQGSIRSTRSVFQTVGRMNFLFFSFPPFDKRQGTPRRVS